MPYGVAWAACFASALLDLDAGPGDPELAARRVVADLTTRRLYPEVAVALDSLRARVPLGIVSNADDAFLSGTLAHNGLAFDLVVYSEAERIYKPDPRLFQRALDRLGAAPDQVLYVGDSPSEDIAGAEAAGMPTVWVNRDGRDWPIEQRSQPKHEVSDLLGVIDVVAARSSGAFY